MLRCHTVPDGGSPSWEVCHFDEGEEKGAWTTAAVGPHLPQGHSHASICDGYGTGTDVFFDVLMATRYLRNGGPVGTRICGPGALSPAPRSLMAHGSIWTLLGGQERGAGGRFRVPLGCKKDG